MFKAAFELRHCDSVAVQIIPKGEIFKRPTHKIVSAFDYAWKFELS